MNQRFFASLRMTTIRSGSNRTAGQASPIQATNAVALEEAGSEDAKSSH